MKKQVKKYKRIGKMEVEITEFYPIERNEEKGVLTGTLRIKLTDLGIHILGIYVTKRNDSWYFRLPGSKGVDHKTGNEIRYPIFTFDDRNKQSALMKAIREQGRAFIEERLAGTEKPLIFPEKKQHPIKQAMPSKASDDATEAKEMALIVNPKPAPTQTMKWSDPPKRKSQPTRRQKNDR